jgi:hypothetical protein
MNDQAACLLCWWGYHSGAGHALSNLLIALNRLGLTQDSQEQARGEAVNVVGL